jgi:hypothetical protein
LNRGLFVYAGLSAVFAGWLVIGSLQVAGAPARTDWMSYHAAARQILDGHGDCLYDPGCQIAGQRELVGSSVEITRGLPYNNPPTLAVLVLPLAPLPLGAALAVWIAAGVLALAAASWQLIRGPRSRRVTLMLLGLSSWPVVTAALHGQVTLLIAALLAGSTALIVHDRKHGPGSLIGLATLKPTLVPVLVVWLALAGRWRSVFACLFVAVAVLTVSALFVTPGQLFAYPAYAFGELTDSVAAGIHVEQMVNWRAAGAWFGGGGSGLAVTIAGSLVTVLVVAIVWVRRHVRLSLAAALIATPLLVPHANQHEATLAVVAWLVLLADQDVAWLGMIGLALQVVSWSALIISPMASGQLFFAALIISLAVVGILAMAERAHGIDSHVGTSTSAMGQRGATGSHAALEG